MKFLVVGCGRAGSRLAQTLQRHGHAVTVIDSSTDALATVAGKGIVTLQGIGFDRQVLIQAGVQQVDGLAAVTGNDEVNVIVARVARRVFQVPRVMARVYDPRKADIYRRLGLLTISPLAWGVDRMAEALEAARAYPLLSLGSGEVHLVQAVAPPQMVGRTVQALNVPGEVQVTAIHRDGRTFLPGPVTVFEEGDVLYLALIARAAQRLELLFG
jgi:trk system potassium uptake protein TrkA